MQQGRCGVLEMAAAPRCEPSWLCGRGLVLPQIGRQQVKPVLMKAGERSSQVSSSEVSRSASSGSSWVTNAILYLNTNPLTQAWPLLALLPP